MKHPYPMIVRKTTRTAATPSRTSCSKKAAQESKIDVAGLAEREPPGTQPSAKMRPDRNEAEENPPAVLNRLLRSFIILSGDHKVVTTIPTKTRTRLVDTVVAPKTADDHVLRLDHRLVVALPCRGVGGMPRSGQT